jgi:hypothetical protein
MWFRIFCPTIAEPTPASLAAFLHEAGLPVVPHFKGDPHGWTTGELHLPGDGSPLLLARYLTLEDNLRADLNSFAAELETMTHSPHATRLMEQVIQTQQFMTIRKPIGHPNESLVERTCETLASWLAEQTDGLYQIDGRGWFAKSGELLAEEF